MKILHVRLVNIFCVINNDFIFWISSYRTSGRLSIIKKIRWNHVMSRQSHINWWVLSKFSITSGLLVWRMLSSTFTEEFSSQDVDDLLDFPIDVQRSPCLLVVGLGRGTSCLSEIMLPQFANHPPCLTTCCHLAEWTWSHVTTRSSLCWRGP